MNLITDKWIDVINKNNNIVGVSIYDIFEKPTEYIDISGKWALRVSIYNLLFTITQASLRGIIKDEESHMNLFSEYYNKYVLEYIKREDIKKYFDFYSKDFFYNFNIKPNKSIEKSYKNDWKKISIDKFSSGNNHTAWECQNIEDIKLTDKQKVQNLLIYMFFDPGRGNNYKEYKNDKLAFSPYGQNEVITYLRGNNFYETIWLNLLDENFILTNDSDNNLNIQVGYPLWEKKPSSNEDVENLKNSQTSYLGLKMPLHSYFSYEEESNDVYYDLVKDCGYNKDFYFRYPHKTYVKTKKKGFYLKIQENKHFMRDFPLLLTANQGWYNTPIIRNVERAKNIGFSNVIIVSGGSQGKKDSSYFTRLGFSEFESRLSLDKKKSEESIYTKKVAEKYEDCLSQIEKLKITKIKDSCKKYPKFFKFGYDSFDDILIKKLIKNLWYEIDNEYSYLIKISQYNNIDFEKEKNEWIKKISKIWRSNVKNLVNNIIKSAILKETGKKIIFPKRKAKK